MNVQVIVCYSNDLCDVCHALVHSCISDVVVIIIIIDFCGNVWFSFNADVMLPNYGCLFGVLCKSNARGRAFV